MKNSIVLNIGGELKAGDVVGIALNNFTTFGWFVEPGQYGSLKYIDFRTINTTLITFDNYRKGIYKGPIWDKKYVNGLSFKNFGKEYIISFGDTNNRAFKISNPEEFFRDSGMEALYQEGKKTLNSVNFPAK